MLVSYNAFYPLVSYHHPCYKSLSFQRHLEMEFFLPYFSLIMLRQPCSNGFVHFPFSQTDTPWMTPWDSLQSLSVMQDKPRGAACLAWVSPEKSEITMKLPISSCGHCLLRIFIIYYKYVVNEKDFSSCLNVSFNKVFWYVIASQEFKGASKAQTSKQAIARNPARVHEDSRFSDNRTDRTSTSTLNLPANSQMKIAKFQNSRNNRK